MVLGIAALGSYGRFHDLLRIGPDSGSLHYDAGFKLTVVSFVLKYELAPITLFVLTPPMRHAEPWHHEYCSLNGCSLAAIIAVFTECKCCGSSSGRRSSTATASSTPEAAFLESVPDTVPFAPDTPVDYAQPKARTPGLAQSISHDLGLVLLYMIADSCAAIRMRSCHRLMTLR